MGSFPEARNDPKIDESRSFAFGDFKGLMRLLLSFRPKENGN